MYLKQMYLTFVRPILEYNTSVWNPATIFEIKRIENVQRAFSRRLPGLSLYPYFERLNVLGLRTLEHRRLCSDLSEVYKITNGLCGLNSRDFFSISTNTRTRGHSKRLDLPPWQLLVRKHSFAVRVIPIWNSLTEDCVSSRSLNVFVSRIKDMDFVHFLKLNERTY